jgi:hypothetical protein
MRYFLSTMSQRPPIVRFFVAWASLLLTAFIASTVGTAVYLVIHGLSGPHVTSLIVLAAIVVSTVVTVI